jgi:hypothetical protein
MATRENKPVKSENNSPSPKKMKKMKDDCEEDDDVTEVANVIRQNMNSSFSEVSVDGIEILSRSGSNSLGDYPHGRHICPYMSFNKDGSEDNLLFCPQCYCYVCDIKVSLLFANFYFIIYMFMMYVTLDDVLNSLFH